MTYKTREIIAVERPPSPVDESPKRGPAKGLNLDILIIFKYKYFLCESDCLPIR